jgi:hypothetical protein
MLKNTRFAKGGDNRVITATLINGNGGYASSPARSEDAQYPMTNLAVNDRDVVWRTAAGLSGLFNAEFDFGQDRDVDVIAVHGISSDSYSAGGTWTVARSNLTLALDCGLQLAAPKRARYWRFKFASTAGGFSISNFYLGLLSVDLGVLYSSGAEDRVIYNRIRSRTMMGQPRLTQMGESGRGFNFQLINCSKAQADTLRTLANETVPLTYLSPMDDITQVVLDSEEHSRRHVASDPVNDVFDVGLSLESYV